VITTLRRRVSVYGALAAMVPKQFLAYRVWVWMHFFVQTIALIIFVSFWRAVYAEGDTLGGLALRQTLNYIILAQIFLPAVSAQGTIFYFGYLLRQGQMGIELLRPLDFQLATYVHTLAEVGVALITQLPLALVAWLLFRFQLPADPRIWLAFLVTLLLGNALLFCFEWMLGCVSFYSTETWGLSVLRFGVATFFSGSLVPLAMMPGWLQNLTVALPFAQALYVPVSLLGGITPLSDAPRIWLVQLVYLLILAFLSRLVFRVAVRKITIQGG
jgi:ABC-2 type transport system permease protein